MIVKRAPRLRTRIAGGLCMVLLGGVAVATALAAPASSPLKRVHTKFAVLADDRYALFLRRGGDHMRIRDTKTGRSANYATRCFPPGSDSFRRGYLLLDCSTASQRSYTVLRLANRAAVQVEDVPSDVQLSGVGRYWVSGSTPANPDGSGQQTVYINWHTHEMRSESFAYVPNPRRNLDDPKLRLRRPGYERGDSFPRHRGPYTLNHVLRGPHAGELILRVGQKRTVLSRCTKRCYFVELLPGLVVWVERAVVHGYALPSRRQLRWPRKGSFSMPSSIGVPTVVGTAYELYIVETLDDPEIDPNPRVRTFMTTWRQALR